MEPSSHLRPGVRVLAVALLVAVLAIPACSSSGGDGDDAAAERTTTEAEGTDTTDPVDDDEGDGPTTTAADDGGLGGDAGDYEAAMSTALTRDTEHGWRFLAPAATCIGPKWVAVLGPSELAAAGITPDDLRTGDPDLAPVVDRDQATEMVRVVDDCGVDPTDYVVDTWDRDGFAAEPVGRCVADELGDEFMAEWLAMGFDGRLDDLPRDDPARTRLREATGPCS